MSRRAPNVLLTLLGVVGLVLKSRYPGPARDLVQSYGGNLAASFAVYFLARQVTDLAKLPRALAAVLAFLAVQLFEVFDGFGVMSNVYDPVDLAANTVGIGIAVAVDAVVTRASGLRAGASGPRR